MELPRRRSRIRGRVREFKLPPIVDGLVIGVESPIGRVAIGRALELLSVSRFEHLPIEDDVMGDVLVRAPILRKATGEELRAFLFEQVRPLMGAEEIVHLSLEVDVDVEMGEEGR